MVNKVILIGNLGADPEVRVLEGGIKVARLRIATTERIFNRATNESKDHTEWHSVTLWRQTADFADKYAKKGSQVYVEGRIRSREWEDPATQTKRFGIDIIADTFQLLGRRESSQGGDSAPMSQPTQNQQQAPRPYVAPEQNQSSPEVSPINDSDDLPF